MKKAAVKSRVRTRRPVAKKGAPPNRPANAARLGAESLVMSLLTPGLSLAAVADTLGMSKSQLAETAGLRRETVYKAARARAPKTQQRMRELLEIVSRVSEWAGGKERALAWYRSQPIAAFGGRTAEALVKTGKATALRDYLDHLAMGGFA